EGGGGVGVDGDGAEVVVAGGQGQDGRAQVGALDDDGGVGAVEGAGAVDDRAALLGIGGLGRHRHVVAGEVGEGEAVGAVAGYVHHLAVVLDLQAAAGEPLHHHLHVERIGGAADGHRDVGAGHGAEA